MNIEEGPPAFVVHNLRQALAAAAAAKAADRPLALITPDDGLAAQGPLFWAEVQSRVAATVPPGRVVLLVDAAAAPGLALAALRCGLQRLIFRGAAPVAAKLDAIVTAAGGSLRRVRPEAIDLLDEPDPGSAVAARLRLVSAAKRPRRR
ncbi:hypothetical protein [Algihabitans albus]|uniref:hypothetical protein n=1 Tax=Algihabitans albus TaxID=2164067 RepID=UPI000E5D5C84|nr:hypothetical protein [Algihabitans albus]